jgi:hypothetical protein
LPRFNPPDSFERRGIAIPRDVRFALTEVFLRDPQNTNQWKAFLGRLSSSEKSALSLSDVGDMPSGINLAAAIWAPLDLICWTSDKRSSR